MDVLLWIFLFFVILYYGFRLFLRYVLPWLLARFVRNQQEKFTQGQSYSKEKKDGEVRIRKDASKKNKDDKSFGEYVEFEDLDNN